MTGSAMTTAEVRACIREQITNTTTKLDAVYADLLVPIEGLRATLVEALAAAAQNRAFLALATSQLEELLTWLAELSDDEPAPAAAVRYVQQTENNHAS